MLELMFGLCAVGLVLAIGVPAYRNVIERQHVARAVRDLGAIAQHLERHKTTHLDSTEEFHKDIACSDGWSNSQSDYALMHQELKRKGATLQLLWEDRSERKC